MLTPAAIRAPAGSKTSTGFDLTEYTGNCKSPKENPPPKSVAREMPVFPWERQSPDWRLFHSASAPSPSILVGQALSPANLLLDASSEPPGTPEMPGRLLMRTSAAPCHYIGEVGLESQIFAWAAAAWRAGAPPSKAAEPFPFAVNGWRSVLKRDSAPRESAC